MTTPSEEQQYVPWTPSATKRRDNMGFGNKIVNLTPEFDFGPEEATRRERSRQLDAADEYRDWKRAADNLTPQIPVFADEMGLAQDVVLTRSYYQEQAEAVLAKERKRRSVPEGFESFPSVKMIVDSLEQAGYDVTPEDLRNGVAFGVLNDAADRAIVAMQAGVETDVRNVYLTLEKSDPILASMLPDVIAAKLQAGISDPTIIDKAVDLAMRGLSAALEPLVALNDATMNRVRAAQWNLDQNADNPEFAFRHLLYGAFSNEAIEATSTGKYNEQYIQELRDSGEYTPLQVDIAYDVARAAVNGDPDAILNVWQDKYAGDEEAAKVFADIVYRRSEGNTQELLRQIDSAYLGNTGQVLLGAATPNAEYNPVRGDAARQDIANATGLVASITLDPTLVFGKAFRTVQAMKWSLTRLAPGTDAAKTITLMGKGRLSVDNPSYRYWKNFSDDLNDLDAMEKRAAAAEGAERTRLSAVAAGMRNRMSRQYSEMPEDLIEDFRVSPWRTPEGQFTPETIAAAIDEMNTAYVTAVGKVSDDIAEQAAKRDALREAAVELQLAGDARAASLKMQEFQDAVREVKRLKTEQANLQSFAGRIASTNQRRTPLVPRMSLIREARMAAVHRLAMITSSRSQAAKIVDNYLTDAGDPALFAQALSDNAVEFGQRNRQYKFTEPAGLIDSTARMFSSIYAGRTISLTSASDARNVYRYARQFFPKRTAEMIADAYRRGTPGSRRLLISGLVRSAAASRGFTDFTKAEVDNFLRDLTPEARSLVTGSMQGEQYAVSVPSSIRPSELAARSAVHKRQITNLKRTMGKEGATPDEIEDAVLQLDAEFQASLGNTRRSLSTDSEGIEHAIHLSQTADNVRLPTLREFEQLRNPLRVAIGNGAERVTNLWSLGTLFGLRFSMRNAIEEVGMYWLLGGKARDFIRGRRLDQAIRKARPRIVIDTETGEPVLRTSLGMIANKAEWTARWMERKGFPEWLAEMVFKQADPDSLKAAGIALAQGDSEAFARLAIESLASQKVFGIPKTRSNLTTEQNRIAFKYLVDSVHGMALLDEVSEAGVYLQSGGYPIFASKNFGIDEAMPDIEYGKINQTRFGAYGNTLPVAATQDREIYGLGFWWRELQTTLDGDGPIGEAAVRLLNDPAKAKAEIARIIREDTEYGYKEKFSRIRSDADVEEFADDYFENVFQHFTKEDGTLNEKLRAAFIRVDADGNEYASWWTPVVDAEGGEAVKAAVSRSDLGAFKRADRPAYIFGREVISEPLIPMAKGEAGILGTRAFAWMGRQNARISRSPIFLANYLDQFDKTYEARQMFARALAEKRAKKTGGEVKVTAEDTALAERMYAQQAMDNAFSLTLAYVDNPANRSNLAWKIRNVSRYYRATEDFYRRVKRVTMNSPESLWKAALTYHLLGESGFTFTNDNGEEYFAYPGNQVLQDALTKGIKIGDVTVPGTAALFGINVQQYLDLNPFSINGKVLGLTPSADLNAAFPSLAGPLAAPVAGVMSAFPALAGIRSVLLGPYNQTSGNPYWDMINTVLPAGVIRVLRTNDPQWVTGQINSAAFDTMALMTAEGMLDELTVNGEPMVDADGIPLIPGLADQVQFRQSDQYKAAQAISVALFILKTAGGFSVPAAPQTMSNTASDFAKQHGIDSMDDLFFDLLDKFKDDPYQYERALGEFFKMKMPSPGEGPYQNWDTFLPFTLSGTKYNMQEQAGAGLARVRATDDVAAWYRQGDVQELFANVGDVAWFLAPKTGEFSWEANALINIAAGVRMPKPMAERYEELFALQGQVQDNQIRNYFDQQIAQATDPEAIKALEEEKKAARDDNKLVNPAWAKVAEDVPEGRSNARLSIQLSKTKNMLEFLRKRDRELSPDAEMIENAINIYTYYKSEIKGLQGTSTQKNSAKRNIMAEMQMQLAAVKESSPNAKQFIEAVLESDPDYAFGEQE